MVWLGNTLKWSSYSALKTIDKLQGEMIHQGLSPILALSAAKAALGSIIVREATIAGIDDAMLMPALVAFMIIPLGFFMSKKMVSSESLLQSKRFTPPPSISK